MKKVRCMKCKGQKKYAGLGAIMKDCDQCDASGLVVQDEVELEVSKEPKVEVVEPDAEVIIENTFLVEEIVVQATEPAEVNVVSPNEKGPIFPGYEDSLMMAILDEPKINNELWKAKYPDIAKTTDVRDRHNIRVLYAQSKPVAPRAVNLSASQDSVASKDAEHMAYERQQQAKAKQKSK